MFGYFMLKEDRNYLNQILFSGRNLLDLDSIRVNR